MSRRTAHSGTDVSVLRDSSGGEMGQLELSIRRYHIINVWVQQKTAVALPSAAFFVPIFRDKQIRPLGGIRMRKGYERSGLIEKTGNSGTVPVLR